MKISPLEQKITDVTRPVVADMGFELVLVRLGNEGGTQTLTIMAEDPATGRLGVDDCAKLSKALSATLDVEDLIASAYRLEMSSPGIDRPLTRMKDFEKYEGFDVKVETAIPLENGQKKFRGLLKGAADKQITVDTDQGEYTLDFDELVKAKLVLTDELIKKTANI